MKGFVISIVGLSLLEAVLAGQQSGKGGNIGSLIAFPNAVLSRFLDPNKPFFTHGNKGSKTAAPASSTQPTAVQPLPTTPTIVPA